jgi:hypothetical protein
MATWAAYPDGGYTVSGLSQANEDAVTATNITANATANQKGTTPTQLYGSTPFAAAGLYVRMPSIGASGQHMFDIMVGPSLAEQVIIPNIYRYAPAATAGGLQWYFPIAIPEGTRISVRSQASTGGATTSMTVGIQSAGFSAGPPRSRVQAIGAVTTNATRGTLVPLDTTAGALGTWQALCSDAGGATPDLTTAPIEELMLDFQIIGLAVNARRLVDIGIGPNGSVQLLIQNIPLVDHANPDLLLNPFIGPFPCSLPAGTQLNVRQRCNITTAVMLDCTAYGVS